MKKVNNGTIDNINIKNNKNRLYYVRGLSLVASAIVFISTLTGCGAVKKKQPNPGQAEISITYEVESGDTLSEIAQKYYTDECESIYDFTDYEKIIEQENKAVDNIEVGQKLEIPVIIDENNEYYLKMQYLKSEIKNIEQNDLWVPYTIQYGDRIEKLAALAAGNYEEIYIIKSKIMSHNHIGSIYNEGDRIFIMNPKLGNLKLELQEAERNLVESLNKTNQKNR